MGKWCRVECRLCIDSGECCAFCKSVVSGAVYASNSSGPRTVPCGTPVVMMFTSDTPHAVRSVSLCPVLTNLFHMRLLPCL